MKKQKNKLDRYSSNDAEFNSLRKLIQQEELNDYFRRINSSVEISLQKSPIEPNSMFSTSELDFKLQKFTTLSKIDNSLPFAQKAGLLSVDPSLEEEVDQKDGNLLQKILSPEDF